MQVRVLFFGVLKDLVGRNSDELSLPDQACAADVVRHYEQSLSKLTGALASIAISINQEYARPEAKLATGDEVALLPPVSGGADSEINAANSNIVAARAFLTTIKIDTLSLVESIKRPEDGAIAIFEGIVRNHSRGRGTVFLEYEAYEEMALKQLESLISQALQQFQIRDAVIVHRLDRLEIGETSVSIIVASAHRAAAFDACRWLIDNLKRTVPIWKKEHFEDGVVWADGEPFPDDLPSKTRMAQGAHAQKEAEGSSPVDTKLSDIPSSRRKNSASNPVARK
jgi:MoaE-MoaD fusion protein